MVFPNNSSFINPINFSFFPLGNVSLIHNWSIKWFQHLLQYICKNRLLLCIQSHYLYWCNIIFLNFTIFFFFFISIANKYYMKNFVVWWFGSDTKLFFVLAVLTSLISSWFLIFSKVFSKNCIIHQAKKIFFKIVYLFFC